METALVRADLARPGFLLPRELGDLRYLLGFAQLTTFRPGAAGGKASRRPDVNVAEEIEPLRARVTEELHGPLRQETDPGNRLHRSLAVLKALRPAVDRVRRDLAARHASDFSLAELDAEAGRKVLVNVAGGGAAAGFVYIGAYELLEEQGIVPAYVIGASIGALLGLFRCRRAAGDWAAYQALAGALDWAKLFGPIGMRRRYGLPGLLRLRLRSTIGELFTREDGTAQSIADLAIPFEAVIAGVRRPSFERLPRAFTHPEEVAADRSYPERLARLMWQVAAFFDPRVVKPIVIGADAATAAFDAVDAAGFSAAIPGVLYYDLEDEDERMDGVLRELCEREDVAAIVDGGVASNVPVGLAWRSVQAGKLGTRNALYLAFDCFHPQWDPKHLWLQPITQAVQLQMTQNAPYAHWVVRFEPTLSPLNLLPSASALREAIDWGRSSIEQALPILRRLLEPAVWSHERRT